MALIVVSYTKEIEDETVSDNGGAESQKVAIAREMASHPSVLPVDKPTASLHSESREFVLDAFKKIRANFDTTIAATSRYPLLYDYKGRSTSSLTGD